MGNPATLPFLGHAPQLRTTERYWNKGERYGPYDDFFRYIFLSNEGYDAPAQIQDTPSPDLGEIWSFAHPIVYELDVLWPDPPPELRRNNECGQKKKVQLSTCEDYSTVSCDLIVVLFFLSV